MIIRSIAEIVSGRDLVALEPETSLRSASRALREANVGALAVMRDGQLLGILSERDVIRRGVCEGRGMDDTSVADVMTPDPVTIETDGSLASAICLMVDGSFRHLPVTKGGQVISMLSMRDIPTEYRLMFERYSEAQDGPQLFEGRGAALVH